MFKNTATKSLLFFILGLLTLSCYSFTQEDILTEISDVYPGRVESSAFRLYEDQEVGIEAVGLYYRSRYEFRTYAWILDAKTREIVWEMDESRSRRGMRRNWELTDRIMLPKGSYEVYYSTYPYSDWDVDSFGDLMSRILDEIFDRDYYRDKLRDSKIIIRGKGERLGEEGIRELQAAYSENAVISMIALYDDFDGKEGFILEKPMDLRIYALGEARRDGEYDHGWIIDTKTRERVWKFTYRYSEHAGGDRKNRMVNEIISLPAGTYAVYYMTDGSHSYRRWNAAPPYDPAFWGITIKVDDPEMKQYIKPCDIEKLTEKNLIVSLTRLRDDEFASKGFTLNRPMNLHIYALGEGSRPDMDDYGWIVNANTHEKVWEMRYRNTEHAGGADKNRLADETVYFDEGNYIVYFVTDGSHSYRNWNTSPPYDREYYGITITSAEEDFKPEDVSEYTEKSENVIVSLTRLYDDEYVSEGFTLNSPMDLRIYAIGEGSGRNMVDYGWIIDMDTHRKMWEMTYYRTEHAGGARKNRMVNEVVHFDEGNYMVYFVTDGSHSYRRWNSSPPFDQEHFGITVSAADESFQKEDISLYREEGDTSILVRLTGIRDRERRRQYFTLEQDAEIRIYAIGEGDRSEMYDYGWIEDTDTGRIVWEMTYHKTDPAGGARKNRMFDGTIMLRAGRYEVFYISDSSHSFNDWNDDPPYDAPNWGITIYKVDNN